MTAAPTAEGSWVIRLSRSPAIPTFYAIDVSTREPYAASFEASALHFFGRADAERFNVLRRLEGVVERCQCPR